MIGHRELGTYTAFGWQSGLNWQCQDPMGAVLIVRMCMTFKRTFHYLNLEQLNGNREY